MYWDFINYSFIVSSFSRRPQRNIFHWKNSSSSLYGIYLLTRHWLILALLKEQKHKKKVVTIKFDKYQFLFISLAFAFFQTGAIKNYSPTNRLTTPLKKIIKSWIFMTRKYKIDFFIFIISMASLQNSIRHNLSLHNRFMRVQNEGTGKSSWWMLNPDAKPGKSVRRRAASMETSKFEKRRGRVKKRVEQLRNGVLTSRIDFSAIPEFILFLCRVYIDVTGVLNDVNSSPGSSVSEGLDLFPESPLHRYLSTPMNHFRK